MLGWPLSLRSGCCYRVLWDPPQFKKRNSGSGGNSGGGVAVVEPVGFAFHQNDIGTVPSSAQMLRVQRGGQSSRTMRTSSHASTLFQRQSSTAAPGFEMGTLNPIAAASGSQAAPRDVDQKLDTREGTGVSEARAPSRSAAVALMHGRSAGNTASRPTPSPPSADAVLLHVPAQHRDEL